MELLSNDNAAEAWGRMFPIANSSPEEAVNSDDVADMITDDVLHQFKDTVDYITELASRRSIINVLGLGISTIDEQTKSEVDELIENIIYSVAHRGLIVGHRLGIAEERERFQYEYEE